MALPGFKLATLLVHGRRILWNPYAIHGSTAPGEGDADARYSLATVLIHHQNAASGLGERSSLASSE